VIHHLERLLRYDSWANHETLHAMRETRPPARSIRWMAHIVGAECLWLSRLRGQPAPLAVWPEIDLDQCGEHLAQLSRSWPEYLETHQGSLDDRISYRNSKGEAWTNSVEDILTHVTIHSAYHRGQIAADVRAAGMEPAYTDYIHGVRQGMLE